MVHAIKCHACHKVEIGETGRGLGDRFREHLLFTRLPDSEIPVGRHFASSGHTTQDMLLSVSRSGFRDATDRRSFEVRMIFRHRNLHLGGLNVNFIVSSKVSASCKRCDFCFYLNVTLLTLFFSSSQTRMKR